MVKERKGAKLDELGGSGSSWERGDHDQNILYKNSSVCVCLYVCVHFLKGEYDLMGLH